MRRAVVAFFAVALLAIGLAPAAGAGGSSFSVTPNPAAPGDEITFVGTCLPGDEVLFGFGTTETPEVSDETTADGSGNWTGSLVIPADTEPGDYVVGAECESDETVSFQDFRVVAAGRIVLLKTVSTTPDECGTEREIVVPKGTTVYYCYAVTNETEFTLDVHTLTDDELGTIFTDLEYDLAPGASVDTVSAGVEASAVIDETTINGAVWTAEGVIPGGPAVSYEADAGAVVTVAATPTTAAAAAAAVTPRFTG